MNSYKYTIFDILDTSNGLSEIVSNLYLGSINDALNINNISNIGIKVIISIRNDPTDTTIIDLYKDTDIKVHTFYFKDKEEYAYGQYGMRQYLGYSYKLINESLSCGSKILVHCTRGVSRSPTIVAAFLIRKYNYTPINALNLIASIRPIIDPIDSFGTELNRVYINSLKHK